MDRELARSQGKEGEWSFLDLEAREAAMDGRYKHAEELFQSAYDAAMRENLPEKASDIQMDEASVEFDGGMPAAARATIQRMNRRDDDPETLLVLAHLGDASLAERALAQHGHGDSSDTLMTYVYGPRIRAAIALDQAKPLEAIAELQPAAEYDFAAGFEAIAERGEAYLMAKEPEKAATEYRKILDHPGVDPASVLRPLARAGLARAEVQAGNIDQGKADYEELFRQWDGADPDLPALLTARREYASLSAKH
jgi:tetratricopeptide (TPR) repeat protein